MLLLSLCVCLALVYTITNSTYAHALVMHDQPNVYTVGGKRGGGTVCWVRAERVLSGGVSSALRVCCVSCLHFV